MKIAATAGPESAARGNTYHGVFSAILWMALPTQGYLPVVVTGKADWREVLRRLEEGYRRFYGESAPEELYSSWRASLPDVLGVSDGFPVIVEYPVLGGLDRVDFIVVGSRRALVVEAKCWVCRLRRRGYVVEPEVSERVDPCYQLENYLAKFRHIHSASQRLEFSGVVYAKGFHYRDSCPIASTEEELQSHIERLGSPGGEEEVRAIVEGRFQISKTLIDFVREKREELKESAFKTLLGGGYGLTSEQFEVAWDILEAVEKGEDRAFLVRGVSGSGKTLVAVSVFLEALAMGKRAILAYRNNRLIHTLRKVFPPEVSQLIKFYATGPQGRYTGIAESNFPVNKYGKLDLVVYDEAQRMTRENIRLSLERSTVKAYFYDDEQLLVGDEEGTQETFLSEMREAGVKHSLYELRRPARIPLSYLRAVRSLLSGEGFRPEGVYVKLYEDIRDMFRALREYHVRGSRVALVCAFTETPGRHGGGRTDDNRRIGYPLCKRANKHGECVEWSDLEIYKGTGLDVYWLMNEETEYPRYWSGELDPLAYCASVYGAQGFEAEHVGVVWGRDLVWRGRWTVNPEPITDNVGGSASLKAIARKDPEKALRLLKNRYLILLTRATKSVHLFVEDPETRKYLKSLLSNSP